MIAIHATKPEVDLFQFFWKKIEMLGARVYEPDGGEVGRAVTVHGRSFTAHACDFADRKALADFTAKLERDHPNIDILVDNAGTIRRAPAAEHPDALWDEVIEVHSFPIDRYTRRPLVVEDHLAVAPDTPGTGVEFDIERLERASGSSGH